MLGFGRRVPGTGLRLGKRLRSYASGEGVNMESYPMTNIRKLMTTGAVAAVCWVSALAHSPRPRQLRPTRARSAIASATAGMTHRPLHLSGPASACVVHGDDWRWPSTTVAIAGANTTAGIIGATASGSRSKSDPDAKRKGRAREASALSYSAEAAESTLSTASPRFGRRRAWRPDNQRIGARQHAQHRRVLHRERFGPQIAVAQSRVRARR